MDGGSSDETVPIIKKYANRITYWESGPDKGQSDAIARGFARATGDIIAYINSDDVYFPGAFETIAKQYNANPEASIYSGGMAIGDMQGRITRCTIPSRLNSYFAGMGITGFGQPSSFFNAKWYKRTPGINIGIYTRMDSDIMYQLLKLAPRSIVSSTLLSFFRWHPTSKSTVATDRYREECAVFRCERGHSRFTELVAATLFMANRFLSGGYLSSLTATRHNRGKTMSEIWSGRL